MMEEVFLLVTSFVVKAASTNNNQTSSESRDYCESDCYTDFHDDSNSNEEYYKCIEEKKKCRMSSHELAFNIGIGLLTFIALIAIVIRCCLAAKVLRGKLKAEKSEADDNSMDQAYPLQQQNVTPSAT